MTDTPAAAEARYRELLGRRTGEERLRMACDMFDAARALVRASLTSNNQNLTPAELRALVFQRIYTGDLDPAVLRRVVERLRA